MLATSIPAARAASTVRAICAFVGYSAFAMTTPARFKQSDVTRALRGAREAGFTHIRLEIDLTGTMVIEVATDAGEVGRGRSNPLDRLLRAQSNSWGDLIPGPVSRLRTDRS